MDKLNAALGIDKVKKIMDIMLKNPEDLTDEEKQMLADMEKSKVEASNNTPTNADVDGLPQFSETEFYPNGTRVKVIAGNGQYFAATVWHSVYGSDLLFDDSDGYIEACGGKTDIFKIVNDNLTRIQKSSAIITNAVAAKAMGLEKTLVNLLADINLPTTAIESTATTILKNPWLKGLGRLGGVTGIIGLILTPISEYGNSYSSSKKYFGDDYSETELDITAGIDACTYGIERSVANAIPYTIQVIPFIDKPKWTDD